MKCRFVLAARPGPSATQPLLILPITLLTTFQIRNPRWTHRTQAPSVTWYPLQRNESFNSFTHPNPLLSNPSSNLQIHFLQSLLNLETNQSTTCYELSSHPALTSTSSRVPPSTQMTARIWWRTTRRNLWSKMDFRSAPRRKHVGPLKGRAVYYKREAKNVLQEKVSLALPKNDFILRSLHRSSVHPTWKKGAESRPHFYSI